MRSLRSFCAASSIILSSRNTAQDFQNLVVRPDLNSHRENALRRALLFLRRGAMWRELPEDTQWYQVKLNSKDLERIRFFPGRNGAGWRKAASI